MLLSPLDVTFVQSYEPKYYYLEVVMVLYRLIMSTVVVLFMPGTLAQVRIRGYELEGVSLKQCQCNACVMVFALRLLAFIAFPSESHK